MASIHHNKRTAQVWIRHITHADFSQIDRIANFDIRGFTTRKKIQWQNVTPSGNRTWTSHSLWLQVQHYPFYTNLTFACKTETLGSLYSHALLISLKSSKSKYQVVHEQQFKDVLSSTCQVSVERIVLDLESEVIRGPNLWENRCVSLFLEINLCHQDVGIYFTKFAIVFLLAKQTSCRIEGQLEE